MAEARILAEQDYMAGMKYQAIADKYNVSLNTVKSWKQRYGWDRKNSAPTKKSVHTNKGGAPPGNQNANGNKGGAAPKRNQNAVTHGLFQKYLPAESLEIIQQLEQQSPLDIVWNNIQIQYAAIIRAQQIMYVKDQEDRTTTLVGDKPGMFGEERRWEVQHAWDKQATFLQAQSRAMATLQSLIKQYEDMCRQGLANEEQELRISKLKAEVSAMDKSTMQEQVIIVEDVHE